MIFPFHKNVTCSSAPVSHPWLGWRRHVTTYCVCGNCWGESVTKIIIFLTRHNIYNCNNISYCSLSLSQLGWITSVPTNIFIDNIRVAVTEIYHSISIPYYLRRNRLLKVTLDSQCKINVFVSMCRDMSEGETTHLLSESVWRLASLCNCRMVMNWVVNLLIVQFYIYCSLNYCS